MNDKRFLLVGGLAESLLNFRAPLIGALQARGLSVHVAAPALTTDHPVRRVLEQRGVIVHTIPLHRTSTGLMSDFRTLWALWRLMRRVRPMFMLAYTVKPVVYGTLAAWMARVPRRYALITGLGYAFQGESGTRRWVQTAVQRLYAISLALAEKVFFQNPDDEALFRERRILKPRTPSVVVNGSGVDVRRFEAVALPSNISFLLIARLLGDKGIREYVAAAARVRAQYPTVDFALAGWVDENPDAIRAEELRAWTAQGAIRYLGRLSDVRPAIAACSVYVLPSYREGTPRTVLEAMAMGRAVITTDAPGCRETVEQEHNGLLVPVRSVDELVMAMQRFVEAPELAAIMGTRSRAIAEEKYDVDKVNAVMLQEMKLLGEAVGRGIQAGQLEGRRK